jgi:hypothetical protein
VDVGSLRQRFLGACSTTPASADELRLIVQCFHPGSEGWSLYGQSIDGLQRGGFIVLGRTAIECVPDSLAAAVARELRTLVQGKRFAGRPPLRVIDPFVGSGNMLRHLALGLDVPGYGAELDPKVHRATVHNLKLIAVDLTIRNCDYRELLAELERTAAPEVVVVEPPWGDALSEDGLDVYATSPPIPDLLAEIAACRRGTPFWAVTKLNDLVTDRSRRFFEQQRMLARVETTGMAEGYADQFLITDYGA